MNSQPTAPSSPRNIKGRILQFLNVHKISQEPFFKSCDISPSNFKGRALDSELGSSKLVAILRKLPEMSVEWLLFGEGPMLKESPHARFSCTRIDNLSAKRTDIREEISTDSTVYQEDTVQKRFLFLVNHLFHGNKRGFSMALGISPSVTENIVGTRGGNPSYEILYKVCACIPVSPAWLLMGEGNVWREADHEIHERPLPETVAQLNEPGQETNYIQRIPKLTEAEGITVGNLERCIGASKGVISRAVNNRTEIQGKWLAAIATTFPRFSMEWLLTGKGPMLKETVAPEGYLNIVSASEAQLQQDYAEPEQQTEKQPYPANDTVSPEIIRLGDRLMHEVPALLGEGALHRVGGESMSPTLRCGDILLCRGTPLDGIVFHWNCLYLLHTDHGTLVRRVLPGQDGCHITAVAENKAFLPVELSMSHLTGVAAVIGILRLE